METNQFALYNGKIVFVPDVPEKPKFIDTMEYVENCLNDKAMKEYREALQSAIASGIEVENQDEVKNVLMKNGGNEIDLHPSTIYPLQCRVEIGYQFQYSGSDRWIDCDVSVYQEYQQKDSYGAKSRKVARVTFEQPEKWIAATKSLNQYPLGTKAKAFNGGYWIKVETGWKWCTGAIFPSVGGDWDGMVWLPEQPEAAGQEQEAYTLDDLRQAFWAGRWRPGLSFENYLEYKQQKP